MKKLIYVSMLVANLVGPHTVSAQMGHIFTVAGNGTAGYSGDGAAATAAELNATEGVWGDAAGNIYFSDMDNYVVRKVAATTGIITTIAGNGSSGYSGDGGPGTAAEIGRPYGLCADAVGNVYFADPPNNVVRRIDAVTGFISTVAGGGSSLGDGGPATAAQVTTPICTYLDATGNLFIAAGARIRRVDATTGIITTIAGTGSSGYSGDGGPATLAQLASSAAGMAIDAAGNLFFADRGNNVIRRIDAGTGFISTAVGTGSSGYSGDGGSATAATLNGPIGIGFDPDWNLIVSDNQNNYIRRVDATTNIITTIAGNGSWGEITSEGLAAIGAPVHPEFIYVDGGGTIFYSDYGRKICKIVFPGAVQYLSVCQSSESNAINSYLGVYDDTVGQTITWALAVPPAHGTAIASFDTVSTGGEVYPVGLGYFPTSGYTGTDTFVVSTTYGGTTDSTTLVVTVVPIPIAGPIVGLDSVCIGSADTLAGADSGGTWVSVGGLLEVSPSGIVTGDTVAGTYTIKYAVANSCGIDSAAFTLSVLPTGECGGLSVKAATIFGKPDIYPNPANNLFFIDVPDGRYDRYTLTDALGRVVAKAPLSGTHNVVDATHYLPGLYCIRLQGAAGTETAKLLKQ
jgi:Secretion system C-terminal sorting domain